MQSFLDYLKEAKELNEADTQKASENKDLANKDASHGDKAEVLPTTVKADGNNYEGDKPDVLDKKINESECEDDGEKKNEPEDDDEKELNESVKVVDDEIIVEKAFKLSKNTTSDGVYVAIWDKSVNKWSNTNFVRNIDFEKVVKFAK